MSYMTKISAIAAVAAVALTGANALAGTTTGSASVTILSPITVTETAQLSFGSISSSATAGTVVVAPGGTVTYGGGVTNFGGGAVPAAFNISGTGNSAYTVVTDTSTLLTSGANSMTVDQFTNNASGSLTAGADSFNIGATLNVGINQPDGVYTGTYNVTVNYQ